MIKSIKLLLNKKLTHVELLTQEEVFGKRGILNQIPFEIFIIFLVNYVHKIINVLNIIVSLFICIDIINLKTYGII